MLPKKNKLSTQKWRYPTTPADSPARKAIPFKIVCFSPEFEKSQKKCCKKKNPSNNAALIFITKPIK